MTTSDSSIPVPDVESNEAAIARLEALIIDLVDLLNRCKASILADDGPAFAVDRPDLPFPKARAYLADGIAALSYDEGDLDGRRTHTYHGAIAVSHSTFDLIKSANVKKRELADYHGDLKASLNKPKDRLTVLGRFSMKMLTRLFGTHRSAPYLVSFTWANRDRAISTIEDAELQLQNLANSEAAKLGYDLLRNVPASASLVRTQKIPPNLRTVAAFRVGEVITRKVHKNGLPLIYIGDGGDAPRFKVNERKPRAETHARKDKTIREEVLIGSLGAQVNERPRHRVRA